MSKQIELSRGYIALVDDEDYTYLIQWNWHAHINKTHTKPYAVRKPLKHEQKDGKRTGILMHRVLVNATYDYDVDHINGDTLDNRKSNLRLVTKSQNIRNSSIRSDNKSGYKGVGWHKCNSMWHARITINGKRKHLGLFDNPLDAYAAYIAAAELYYGDYANGGYDV